MCHGTTTTRERAIHQGVLYRKISGDRRTWAGAEVFEVILSTYETAKKRGDRFVKMVRAKFDPPVGARGCGVGAFLKVGSYDSWALSNFPVIE